MIDDRPAAAVERQDHPVGDLVPGRRHVLAERYRTRRGLAQRLRGRHVDVGVVVDALVRLARTDRVADLVATSRPLDARHRPVGNVAEHRPCVAPGVVAVAGRIDVSGKGKGDVEGHMVLGVRTGTGGDLVAVDRTALPWIHGAPPAMKPCVVPGGLEVSMAVVEQRPCRIGRQQQKRRHRERLDVPHHVAVVVVVVGPVRQPEQRCARQRRGMDRAQQVVGARIDDRLPARVSPVDRDAALPEIVPDRPVFLAESLATAAGTKRGEPAGLLVRLRHARGSAPSRR